MQKLAWRIIGFFIPVTILFLSCKKNINEVLIEENISSANHPGFGNGNLPFIAGQRTTGILFTNPSGYHVYNGGYGSALATIPGPGQQHFFYYMTDRGPNVDRPGGKYFPTPSFNPHIAVFKLEADSLRRIKIINFKDQSGQPLTGLPNPASQNPTGEIPYDAAGNILPFDPNGIDCEGLAVMPDGSFWVSDEYGPHIVHFDPNGKTIERISPFQNGTVNREIPKVFIRRRANRGMEGLAVTPDGQWLAGIMQSPLDNPGSPSAIRNQARNSRIHRILFFNIVTGSTKQYLYKSESTNSIISEIISMSNNEFLVLERDGNYPLPGNPASSFKRVYKINISGADDVSDPGNTEAGKLINGMTIEVAAFNNDPGFLALDLVSKSLMVDIITAFPQYPHDKPEGIALIGNNLLAVSNDDDFGVIDDGVSNYVPKYLPFFSPTQVIDKGVTYFIQLSPGGN